MNSMTISLIDTVKPSLLTLALYLQIQGAPAQEANSNTTDISTSTTTTDHHHNLEDGLSLIKLIFMSLVSSCVLMFVFFCCKLYGDYRARQVAVANPGPFGAMREISVYDMTLFQRRAVLEALFPDDKCFKFEEEAEDGKRGKVRKGKGGGKYSKVDQVDEEELSPTSIIDEACGKDNGNEGQNSPPSLPTLAENEVGTSVGHEGRRKRGANFNPLSFKSRPFFSLLPSASNEDDDDHNDVSNSNRNNIDVHEDEEMNITGEGLELSKDNKCAAKEIENYTCTNEEGGCSICLDEYEPGELIVKSKHCTHYFHKKCILDWLEKNYCCPICRVDMITTNELIDGISRVVSETGTKRAIQIRSEVELVEIEVTPPSSPTVTRSTRLDTQPEV